MALKSTPQSAIDKLNARTARNRAARGKFSTSPKKDEKTIEIQAKKDQKNKVQKGNEEIVNTNTVFADSDMFIQNMLNNYEQVAYHFTLFMVPEKNALLFQESQDKKELDKSNKTVIAESGVTSEFTIKSVDLDSIVGAHPTVRNVITTGFNIEIFESKGLTFLDKLIAASKKLEIKRIIDFPVFLSLSWKGYNTNGVPIDIPGFNKLWPITMTKISPEVDVIGTTYKIAANLLSNKALHPNHVKLHKAMPLERVVDLRTFFLELERALNKREEETKSYMIEALPKTAKGKFYKINADALLDKLPNVKFDLEDTNNNVFEVASRKFTLSAEQDLRIIVDAIMNEYIDAPDPREDKNPKNKYQRFKRLVGIKPIVSHGVFIDGTQEYPTFIEYQLYLKSISRVPMIDADEEKKYLNTEQKLKAMSKQVYEMITDLQLLDKKYEFNFSGKNTEVLKADVNFDALWNIALSSDQYLKSMAKLNSINAHNSSLQEIKEQISKEGNIKNVQAGKVAAQQEVGLLDKAAALLSIETEASKTVKIFENREKELNAQSVEQAETKQAELEAERARISNPDRVKKITLLADFALDKDQKGSLIVPPRYEISWAAVDKSKELEGNQPENFKPILRGSLVEQAYRDGQGTMLTIDLEIKGDPYWLGRDDFEENVADFSDTIDERKEIKRASFHKGEHHFVFKYMLPLDVGEDGKLNTQEGQTLRGVYNVVKIKSEFQDGRFIQVLSGVKNPDINF